MKKKPLVLIVTRSDDNHSIELVSTEIEKRGGCAIRLNSDQFPTEVSFSCKIGKAKTKRILHTPDSSFDLNEVSAVWYRRFNAGGRIPRNLGDTLAPCIDESRRALFGSIANLDCFHLDPLECVRRCDHKEWQVRRANELGLQVPETLFSNSPNDVKQFYMDQGGEIVCKMQSSFAIYRQGIENVVFTTPVSEADINDLNGLKYCPMIFQQMIPKSMELRTTIIGNKVLTASIDSQKQKNTRIDWRRDGIGLIKNWQEYELPKGIQKKLLTLLSELGLNYGTVDFAVTPKNELVFFEVNAVGEFMWLQDHPGLPIAEAIADVLLNPGDRRQLSLKSWNPLS